MVGLGMEMDMRDVDLVLHCGSERCARDGRHGISDILYNKFTISMKTASEDIVRIVTNVEKNCNGKQILQHMSIEHADANEPVPVCKGCEDV
ncbi:hypothetical protein ACJMK2_040772 [Sinanodonta woodiana]|uniref:Uncharacterized protein n=1 Tax=Sinanodonta woodiana TaxID=1069815 RepID=A0ABD3W2Z2_SINWO